MSDTEKRKALADGMRKMADFVENESVPFPNMFDAWSDCTAWHSLSKADLRVIAREAARMGLTVEKKYLSNQFSLKVGTPEYKFSSFVDREVVCRRVDTGETKMVKTYPTDIELVDKEVPVYEWVCDEPLLSEEK